MNVSRLTARVGRHALPSQLLVRRHLHKQASEASTILRSHIAPNARYGRKRVWPLRANSLHNITTTRAISFTRVLPGIALKLVRIPAMFGTAIIAGLAYLQYQATRKLLVQSCTDLELIGLYRGWKLCHGRFHENKSIGE